MVPTLIIVFREVLEAALVIGIVMAASKGVFRRGLWVSGGVLGGLLGAVVVAVFAEAIANAVEGMGQEIFNACVLFAAVVMLGWHNVWMGRHGRELAADMNAIGGAVREGSRPLYALALVVAIAVLREGSEIVLFLYGIAVASQAEAASMLAGGALGLAAGAAIGLVIYFGLLRLPIGSLFAVTTGLILFLAAGMAAQGAAFLNQAGILPALGYSLWDTSGLISDNSVIGRVLHILIGYTAEPSGIQLVFYLATLIVIAALMWLTRAPPRVRHAAA